MELEKILSQEPKKFSPCGSGSTSSRSYGSSPDFEFWMVRNPSCPKDDILSADELFSDGVLLPLHLLPYKQIGSNLQSEQGSQEDEREPKPEPERESSFPSQESESGPSVQAEPATVLSASKRWRDIFRKEKGKSGTMKTRQGEERRREKKCQSQGGVNSPELNIINIWPFPRSRSAGNSVSRPKIFSGAPGTRKVSSTPCSRSNSSGECMSRVKSPNSPGRSGVHLGVRSTPVWQMRRPNPGTNRPETVSTYREKCAGKKEISELRCSKINCGGGEKAGTGSKVVHLGVPMCIGYKSHMSCRSDEDGVVAMGLREGSRVNGRTSGAANANHIGSSSSHFSLRDLFTKKVY